MIPPPAVSLVVVGMSVIIMFVVFCVAPFAGPILPGPVRQGEAW
jgi:hypothetical protein